MPERGGAHVHPLVRGARSRPASGASNWAIGTAQYGALDGHDGEYCSKYIGSLVLFNCIYGVHGSIAYGGFFLFFALVPFILLDPRLDGSVDRMTLPIPPFEFSGMVS